MTVDPSSIMALDVGEKRVGVAVANSIARLPRALATLEQGDNFQQALQELIDQESVSTIVVGLPRGLNGQETAQTQVSENFAEALRRQTGLPVYMQDEALTSKKAEAELEKRGKKYQKGDVDALAATYILADYLAEQYDAEEVSL